jgi:hypothetical protein
MTRSVTKREICQRHQQATVSETAPIAMTLLHSDPKYQTVLISLGEEWADEIEERPRFLEFGKILRNGEHLSIDLASAPYLAALPPGEGSRKVRGRGRPACVGHPLSFSATRKTLYTH